MSELAAVIIQLYHLFDPFQSPDLSIAGKVVYEELVPEITTEPNYDAALAALK